MTNWMPQIFSHMTSAYTIYTAQNIEVLYFGGDSPLGYVNFFLATTAM